MVFSSIKPEKRFSQWRRGGGGGGGLERRSDTENKRFALPLVCDCEWKVERGGGEGERGE